MKSTQAAERKRIPVTLAPGQYERLDAIAKRNNATLAFVVRQAVESFLEGARDRQIKLTFPDEFETD